MEDCGDYLIPLHTNICDIVMQQQELGTRLMTSSVGLLRRLIAYRILKTPAFNTNVM